MTGIGDLLPTSVITWTPQGVTLSGATHHDGQPVTYGTAPHLLHRPGRT
jgi:hypothetical protein